MPNEDSVPQAYKYSWSSSSEITLEDFLTKFKPSMVQNDGTKPWIWVHGSGAPADDDRGEEEAEEEASKYLEEITEKVEAIKNDDSIPVRSNKKTGAKSKKEVREQVQAEASAKLKEISVKHGYVVGKWLMFASSEKIDQIWAGIAKSLVSGPLSETTAFRAKVSTSPENETPNYQHLICVYMPDVYNKEKVTEVMKILLRNHGVNLSGVKSDLYTSIGLDSKHPSGIPSTAWKNTALLPDKEIKELKDAFFAELASKKAEPKAEEPKPSEVVTGVEEQSSNTPKVKTKAKPKLKKKVKDDPFASDDGEETKKPAAKGIKRGPTSDNEDERPGKKTSKK
ncbi:hypothetical protein D9613_000846 [Agrocybe pediades]|uniref:Uncharacterized protein n=1 Tax=Agrocybe pediades TaxID=84607 RepID=A0A8H4VV07_9AGAR|nr:hypothetical protein D9613_000846 [Agrocybe pediades]